MVYNVLYVVKLLFMDHLLQDAWIKNVFSLSVTSRSEQVHRSFKVYIFEYTGI